MARLTISQTDPKTPLIRTVDEESNQLVTVLFIGGYPRSGSTILDRLLGQLPGTVSLGELRALWSAMLTPRFLCGCGETMQDCQFWTSVTAKALSRSRIQDCSAARRLQEQVDTWWRTPQLLLRIHTRSYRQALHRYLGLLRALYVAIQEESGCSLVIDSSKDVSPAYLLRSAGAPIDLRLVHLVRDSRAVAFSSARPKYDPGRSEFLRRSGPVETSLAWNAVNLLLEPLKRLGTPSLMLRYEDFVKHPSAALREVLRLASLADTELPVDESGGAQLGPSHNIGGNPVRYHQGPLSIRADERWRTAMTIRERAVVTALTWPVLRHYERGTLQPRRDADSWGTESDGARPDPFTFPPRARRTFYMSYLWRKVGGIWVDVHHPKVAVWLYEMMHLMSRPFTSRLLASRFTPPLIQTRFGTFQLRPGTSDLLLASPAFERDDIDQSIALLSRWMRAGRSFAFVDVGANLGTYSVAIGNKLKRSPLGRVVAFEPASENFTLLRENIRLNDLQEIVKAHRTALWSCDEETKPLFVDAHMPGSNTLLRSHSTVAATVEPVPVSTLDSMLLEQSTEYDAILLKIDVEGAERAVLEGGRRLLQRTPQVVILIEDFVEPRVVSTLRELGARFLCKVTPYNSWWQLGGEQQATPISPGPDHRRRLLG